MLTSFVIRVEIQDVLELIELGLLVELGNMKKAFRLSEDDENLSKIIQLGKELNERVRGMGLISKGVHR